VTAAPPSFWLDGPAPPPRPPLAEDLAVDVAVVGAGIAGLATAYALAREDQSVAVLERDRIAGAASGRNAGFVLAGVAENYVAACRRYGEERASRIWRTTTTNRVLLAAIVKRHRIDCDLAWNGSLQQAGDDEEWEEIRESSRQLSEKGVRVTLDPERRAACYEEDGEVHPVRMVRGMAAAALERGVRIFEGSAVTALRADGVTTSGGTVKAGAVVVCANAYSEALLPRVRIVPIRGQMLATAPVSDRLFARPVYGHRGYRYWRQTAEGRVLVGGWRNTAFDEETGTDARPTETIQRHLDAFLAEHGISVPVTHRWAGIMGFSHDSLPYIGRRADGIYMNAGFTGHGNAFAVVGSEIVTSLIRSGRHPDADLFDPERA
jgi:gamma-glutamylputrescine oxidase